MGGGGSTTYTQHCFRLRNDNGSETGATWVQNLNTNGTFLVDTNYRIRFTLYNDVLYSFTGITFNLYVSKNGGAYTAIGTGQAAKYSASSYFTQGDDTTKQLYDFDISKTYITDNNGMCESAGATLSGGTNNYWELEYCIQVDSSYVDDADTLTFRVYSGTTALATYTQTPSITVSEGGGSTDELTATDITSGVPTVDKPTLKQVSKRHYVAMEEQPIIVDEDEEEIILYVMEYML